MNEALYNKYRESSPEGTIPCWMIENDDDRYVAIQEKRPFSENGNFMRLFQITGHPDPNIIEGFLWSPPPYGHGFHDDLSNNAVYLERYNRRETIYISFDRVTLYRVLTVRKTKPLTFVLRLVENSKAVKLNTAFMIMPFKFKGLNTLYQKHIKEFLHNELQIEVLRADDFSDNDVIIDTIYRQIEDSEIIIADITYNNKNAFYELGYAAAKEKEIITIQNRIITKAPFFDRAHIRSIRYSKQDMLQFKSDLVNTINSIRSRVSNKN